MEGGALEVYPVCECGAIERVQALGGGKIIGLDTTVRAGALMVRKDSKIQSASGLRNVPIAVTWHAGTFYAAIEVLEAAGVPFEQIKLVHANDRLDALLRGTTEAAALMEPLVSRALAAGAREIANLRWSGGIIARSPGCARAKTVRARRCCAILPPSSASADDAGIGRRQGLRAGGISGKSRLDGGSRLP